jgi:hypothetical protein
MAPPKAEDKSGRPDARILDRVLKREKRERRAGQAADVASLSGIDKTDRSGT